MYGTVNARSHAHRGMLVLALLSVCGLCSTASAQQRYQSVDRLLVFDYPASWQTKDLSGKVQLIAPDGSHYLVQRDTVTAPSDDPANDAVVRAVAKRAVAALIPGGRLVSAEPITMIHGQGAAFLFRGSGASANEVEVWVGIVGRHSVVISPEKAGQSNQTVGLSSIFEELTFTDSSPRSPAQSGTSAPSATVASRQTTAGSRTVSAIAPRTATVTRAQAQLMEGYDGHLRLGDVDFKLTLLTDGTATATWQASLAESARFAGSYTGEDGDYSVKLTQVSGTTPYSEKSLTLLLRSSGDAEVGSYVTDQLVAAHTIAGLKLTDINIDKHFGLRGVKPSLAGNTKKTTTTTPKKRPRRPNPTPYYYVVP